MKSKKVGKKTLTGKEPKKPGGARNGEKGDGVYLKFKKRDNLSPQGTKRYVKKRGRVHKKNKQCVGEKGRPNQEKFFND